MPILSNLDDAQHARIIRFAPLVAVDLIIRDPLGKVLVGLRANEPAKDFYFVPGGRIRKGEKLSDAFERILRSETGLDASFHKTSFMGVYEHFYTTNRYDDPDYGTHYVVLAYSLSLSQSPPIVLDSQHTADEWMDADTLRSDPRVHDYTKAYFDKPRQSGRK